MPTLVGCSPLVVPKPSDWPHWAEVTGYWLLDSQPGYQLPPEVEAFLQRGPPPVCVNLTLCGSAISRVLECMQGSEGEEKDQQEERNALPPPRTVDMGRGTVPLAELPPASCETGVLPRVIGMLVARRREVSSRQSWPAPRPLAVV